MMRWGLLIIISLCIAACSSGRYSQRNDSFPTRPPSKLDLRDAIPVYEPYTRKGNGVYTVFGRTYRPMQNSKGFSEQGQASWYGQKFHGHLTSNGEIYDMYAMSAAHKTLPIPSFVRVTNTANQKQVVVRVNDRGPFHGKRVIDLSYAAAVKLDMLKTGTADVRIDVIHVDMDGIVSIAGDPVKALDQPSENVYVQVTASSNKAKVESLAVGLSSLYQVESQIPDKGGIYRLRLGPLASERDAKALLTELKGSGYQQAYMLTAP